MGGTDIVPVKGSESSSADEKLKVKALGPAAESFGKEVAPLGQKYGALVTPLPQ